MFYARSSDAKVFWKVFKLKWTSIGISFGKLSTHETSPLILPLRNNLSYVLIAFLLLIKKWDVIFLVTSILLWLTPVNRFIKFFKLSNRTPENDRYLSRFCSYVRHLNSIITCSVRSLFSAFSNWWRTKNKVRTKKTFNQRFVSCLLLKHSRLISNRVRNAFLKTRLWKFFIRILRLKKLQAITKLFLKGNDLRAKYRNSE